MDVSRGMIGEVNLGSAAFEHLDREWIVCIKLLGSYVQSTPLEGDQKILYFALMDPVFERRPTQKAQCRFRRLGEAAYETLTDKYIAWTDAAPLSELEIHERERLETLIGEQPPSKPLSLNSLTSGAVRIFGEKRCFQEEFGTPRLEHSLDCGDLLYGTHCLHCGTELTNHIARCPACKKIRLGFECIEPFVEQDQVLSAPDVFGNQVMTDVREPDQGTWIGAFRFLELYLQEHEGNHEEE